MRLGNNWLEILKRAWSVRFIAVAGLLTGLETVLPLAHAWGWLEWMPRGVLAGLSFVVVCGAFVSRFLVQRNLGG